MTRLIQYIDANGLRQVGRIDPDHAEQVNRLLNAHSVYQLAQTAIAQNIPLATLVAKIESIQEDSTLSELLADQRVLSPVDHPDPAHLYVTGTGLTHTGSADTRNKMHSQASDDETDSMKMFRMGLEGGKPNANEAGVQPEWFYKGDGSIVIGPEQTLPIPRFSLDASEEPELVGCYINGPDGTPYRIGYALGNELSDHVTERENYLYLAHSKLRACSFGPELLIGPLPDDIQGTSRIRRQGDVIWEKPFASGEANMSHTLANLEHHHFKYALFRRPGDVHLHYFGTATLSFADMRTEPGDCFEISAPIFGQPLRNRWGFVESEPVTQVKSL